VVLRRRVRSRDAKCEHGDEEGCRSDEDRLSVELLRVLCDAARNEAGARQQQSVRQDRAKQLQLEETEQPCTQRLE
jgi:hypothetical protein